MAVFRLLTKAIIHGQFSKISTYDAAISKILTMLSDRADTMETDEGVDQRPP